MDVILRKYSRDTYNTLQTIIVVQVIYANDQTTF